MRGILFDKDGTLLDFEATWTPVLRRLALEAAGGDADRAATLMEAGGFNPATSKFRAGSAIGAGTTKLIARLFYPLASDAELDERVAAMDATFLEHGRSHSVPIDGVGLVLEILGRRGYVMGVATNDATEAGRAALEGTGMALHLPHVFGYDAVEHPKPAPDMVIAFAKASGTPIHEIAVVGDNVHDLQMARTAGAGLAIGVTSGNSSAVDLKGLADIVLPSIRELPAWLHERQNKK